MTIYLACTVRGGRSAVPALRDLVADLESRGHTILTKHLLDDDVEGAEGALTEQQVYERDIKWLDSADVLIADASGSSFGVGFEVGWVLANADRTGKRVVLLYRSDRRDLISRLIAGNAHPRCTVLSYADAPDLVAKIRAHVT